MTISEHFELANNGEFRLLANFSAPPRAGRIVALEPSGQVRVESDDLDGGEVLAWPLNGFSYAVSDVVYIAFAANNPDSALVIGSQNPLPTLDASVLPEAYVPVDGSDPLTADWDIGEDRRIKAEALRARDGEGLRLEDDAGNLGVFIEDGGQVGINNSAPDAPLDITATATTPRESILRARVSDSSDAFYISNGTITGARFVPLFTGYRVSNATAGAIQFNGVIDDGLDTGSDPVVQFIARLTDGDPLNGNFASVATRPLFDFQNLGTVVLRVLANGSVGMGTTSPQGKLHLHDGTSGLIFVTKSNIDNVAQTVIPNGTGDVVRAITGFVVIYDGAGTIANTVTLLPGDNLDVSIGTMTLRLALNVNGALTVVRQSGTGTATLTLLAIWM